MRTLESNVEAGCRALQSIGFVTGFKASSLVVGQSVAKALQSVEFVSCRFLRMSYIGPTTPSARPAYKCFDAHGFSHAVTV
mmetsp:Transcript_16676/g.29805  ORF Transcript_16676/g.29805 Transcript_16676/m.29805 type:complete len:81 (-) Transcript_16676:774-1016(-)